MLEIENAIDHVKYVGAAWRRRIRERNWFARQMLAWHLNVDEAGQPKSQRVRRPTPRNTDVEV